MLKLRFGLASLVFFLFILTGSVYAQQVQYDLFETEYEWLEILDIGDPLVNLHNNDFLGPFPIGYPFPFYNEIYEEIWISSNGFIGFGPVEGYASFENQEFPNRITPNNIIAGFWKDLDPEAFWADGMVYVGMRDGKRIIQYEGVAEHNQDGQAPQNTITMQIVLERNGDIILQYKEIGDEFDLEEGTIGVENQEGTQGFVVRHNGEGAEIQNETAYLVSFHGPGNFLVWDGGANTPSGFAQAEALRSLGHTVTHLQLRFGEEHRLPENLNQYEAVFINLGNFGINGRDYHTLTEEEGRTLANYLEAGGSVYLEGSDTWNRDEATEAHPFFFIEGVDDGSGLLAPVTGQEGTFADGMVFEEYDAENNDFVDHLNAIDDAEAVFTFIDEEDEEEVVGMIAYWGEEYRTVGCSFEFGGLVDGDDGDKEELMRNIIDFFRAPPPEFPPPLNLSATVGDGEVTLHWDRPRRVEQFLNRDILNIQRHIARLSQPRDGSKPDPEARMRINRLRDRLDERLAERRNLPRRDELQGYNIYLDEEEYDFTNAENYVVFDLENNQPYEFSVTAVYEDPNGESAPAGPIVAVPTSVIEPGWNEGFEQFNGALNPVPANNGWEWGEPEFGAAHGDRAWGTLIDRPYPDNAVYCLYMPIIDLEEAEDRVWLNLNHFMDAEAGWDGGRVEISIDDDRDVWELLTPADGYNMEHVFALDDDPGFSGVFEDWENIMFDLTGYIGDRIRIRFVFKSDFGNFREYDGWFIDDLSIVQPEVGALEVTAADDFNDEIRIQNARVAIENIGAANTDANGIARIENIPVGQYEVITTKLGFLPDTSDAEIRVNELTQLNVFLIRWDSQLVAEQEEFVEELNFDDEDLQIERQLTVVNTGGSETTFKVFIDYFVGMNRDDVRRRPVRVDPERDDPWELIRTYDLTEETGEQFFIGAQFVRNNGPLDYRLIAGAGDFHSGDCRFYQYSREGDFIGHAPQNYGAIVGWGLRDLAYDGRYVYGSNGDRIRAMNPITGAHVNSFQGAPLNINRAIAYAPEDETFWVGDWDDTWFKIDRNGNVLDQNSQHGLTGVAGMAWNPVDPDGAYLYIHNQESEAGGGAIYRYNPETRELNRQMTTAEEDEGFAGGAFITYLYDTHNYALGCVVQGPETDVVKLYEMHERQSWLSIAPTAGEIDGNEGRQDFTITFDATGLYETVENANIVIIDERAGEELEILCELTVLGGAASLSGTVQLNGGEGDVTNAAVSLNNQLFTQPDQDGFFEFPRLDPGEYILRGALFDYAPFESEPFELEPGDERVEFDFELNAIQMGSIGGMAASVHDQDIFISDVEITVINNEDDLDVLTAQTDENGEYLIELETGTYLVSAYKPEWGREVAEDVQVNAEELTEVNFEMDDRRQVQTLRTDGYHDDSIELFWLPPGSGGVGMELRCHDGMLANGIYMVNRGDILAAKFEPEGTYDLLKLVIYTIRRRDPVGGMSGWPDWGMDNILVKVFEEDPETGFPSDIIFERVLDDNLRNDDNGWDSLSIDDLRFREGPFFIGWEQDPNDDDHEAVGLDENYDHEGTSFAMFDNEWREYDQIPGDMIVEALVWSHEDQEQQVLSHGLDRRNIRAASKKLSPAEIANSVILKDPAYPGVKLPEFNYNWKDIYDGLNFPRRDPAVSFRVYVDGDARAEVAADAYEWIHEIGSENENREYSYSVSAFYEDGEDVIEIEGVESDGIANMPPGQVRNIDLESDGLNFTIEWDEPLWNHDGSPCVDYEDGGCEVYFDGELLATVEAPETIYEGQIQENQQGWHTLSLVAFDEVPNRGIPTDITAPFGRAIVYNFEVNTPVFEADPRGGAWERSRFLRNGPEDAHSGRYAYGTDPDDGEYEDNCDWTITSLDEYYVESETARLEFYHFLDAETGHDGGQALIKANDGEWELLHPEEDYTDLTIAGLNNRPGFTGRTNGWELVTFNLAEYEGDLVQFKLRFASDNTIHNYPGWYIDDFVLWGCSTPDYATIAGNVRDQNDQPVPMVRVTDGRIADITDFNGNFTLDSVLPGDIVLSFTRNGYQSTEREMEVEAGEFIDLDVDMIGARIGIDPEQFEFELGGNDALDVDLQISNQTEIDLPYWIRVTTDPEALDVDRGPRRADDAARWQAPRRDDPWDIAFEFNLTENTNRTRIMGAEFAHDRFYLTAADPLNSPVVLVLDWQGSQIGSFDQPVEPRGWGLRDLAWDGELLYASQDDRIYGFDRDGELVSEQAGADITLNRALAYDSEQNGFWTAEWNSPWYFINRDGEVEVAWDGHGLEGVYGMAFHQEDPENLYLYALNLENDGSTGIYRANPTAEEPVIERVAEVDGAPTGCFITSAWDSDRWIIGAVTASGGSQYLTGFELNGHTGWLSVEPAGGVLEAEANENIELRIRVPGEAEEDEIYTGEIAIHVFGSVVVSAPFEANIIEGFRHFDAPEETDQFHTIIVESAQYGDRSLPVGSEIAAVTPRGDIGGVLRWVMAPGEFRAYRSRNGFQNGDHFDFLIWVSETDNEREPVVELVEGDRIFNVGGETTYRFSMAVPFNHRVELNRGWNLVSTNVDPWDPSFESVLSDVNEDGNLIIAKDGFGRFWWPEHNYNGLDDWNVLEGYQLKVIEEDRFTATGDWVDPETPIELLRGWNMISYLPDEPIDSRIALGNILEDIEIAKDGYGHFMVPELGFYGLGMMNPGLGYKVKVREAVDLVYNIDEENAAVLALADSDKGLAPTGSDMSLLIVPAPNFVFKKDFNIGVYTVNDNRLIGSAHIDELPAGIILRGDDITTEETDGALEQEFFKIVIESTADVDNYFVKCKWDELSFETDGLVIAEIADSNLELPLSFKISAVHPNPFNARTSIKFGLPENTIVSGAISDVNGRIVKDIAAKEFSAGWRSITVDAANWSSGIYLIELSDGRKTEIRKIVLTR